MRKKLFTFLLALVAGIGIMWATENSITINGTPQVGDNSISLTYYFDPDNVPGLDQYAPTLKVKCAADNKWDEMWLSLSDISSGTETISLDNLGSFQEGKTYDVCFAYFNGNWVDDVFQSFTPATPAPANPSGSCGENLTWEFDPSTGALTISGTGAMDNYSWNPAAPWNAYKDDIASVSFPEGITTIGAYAFVSCDNAAFTTVTIPEGVTALGVNAFYNCDGIKEITIPSTVATMEAGAIYDCKEVNSITSYIASPTNLHGYAIYGYKSTCTLYVPYNSIAAYQAADCWKYIPNIAAIPGTEPAPAPTVYNSGSVALSNLNVGDILMAGVTLTDDSGSKVKFVPSRLKIIAIRDSEFTVANFVNSLQTPLLGENAAMTFPGGLTITPINKEREDGNAWVVTEINVAEDTPVTLAGITYSGTEPDPATPTVWTSLSVGDVIKVGDQLSPSEEWKSANDHGIIKPAWAPYTLLRANIAQDEYDEPVVTEAEDGAYYVLKFTHPSAGTYYLLANSAICTLLAATATSDGLEVTNVEDYYGTPQFTFAVHESAAPQPQPAVEIGDLNNAEEVTAFLNTYDGQTIDELIIDRPVLNNMYNTLCLPFDMNAAQIAASSLNGVEIREFTGASVEGTTLNLSVGDPVNAVVAGRPYFVKYSAASQLDNLHFEDVTINNALLDNMAVTFDGVTFKGTFTPFVMPNGLNFQGGYLFLGQNNQLFWPNTSNPLKQFRAYFYVDVESSTPGNAPKYRGMPARIVEGKNVATGVENAQSANQSTKVIVNGQLIIIKNDVRYNAQGQIVK